MTTKTLLSYTSSHVGLIRTKNDDSSYAGKYLCIVADGMGGHAGGDTASAATVLELVHLDHPRHNEKEEGVENLLIDDIQTANSLLSELASEHKSLTGMGTTATALLLTGENLQFAHIGDSRAYRLKDDIFEQISTDHTYVQKLVEEGEISPQEAANHPNKNVVTRVLGDVTASPEIDTETFQASVGERWLLASDGLTDIVSEKVIEHLFRKEKDIKKIVETLTDYTLDGGATDNLTILICEVTDDQNAEEKYAQETVIPEVIEKYSSSNLQSKQTLDNFAEDVSSAGYPPLNALATLYYSKEIKDQPHVLAGAANKALETATVPATVPLVERLEDKQANYSTNDTDEEDEETSEDGADEKKSGQKKSLFKKLVYPLSILAILGLLAAAAFGFYAWTQTKYYVAPHNDKVAIYKGIHDNIGPFHFSHLEEDSNTKMNDLDDYARQNVEQSISADSKEQAEKYISDLPQKKKEQPKPKPRNSNSDNSSSSSNSSNDSKSSSGTSSSPSETGGQS